MHRYKTLFWGPSLGLITFFSACDPTPTPNSSSNNQPLSSQNDLAPKSTVNNKNDRLNPALSEGDDSLNVAPKPPQASGQTAGLLANGGFGGGGGGSQGAYKRAETGNPDDDRIEARCGNGAHEVKQNQNVLCTQLIYGATNLNPSSLYYFDKDTGSPTTIGTIAGFSSVSAIDFSPDGTLYAVGNNLMANNVLFTINCSTAQGTGIAPISGLGRPNGVVTDINFDKSGQLWAVFKSSTGPSALYTINPLTAQASIVGATNTGVDPTGGGLGFSPFPGSQDLFYAHNTSRSILNQATGAAGSTLGLSFPVDLANNPRINAIDLDPYPEDEQVLYVSILDDTAGNYLGELDPNSGIVSRKNQPAPAGLDAIAVNRNYEECDPKANDPLPSGAICKDDCTLAEDACADSLDNDFDGLIDCDDSDCEQKSCTDNLECTSDSVCQSGTCLSFPIVCNDMNPCTDDACQEPQNPGDCFAGDCCVSSDIANLGQVGQCETDGRACTVGKCVAQNMGAAYCFEQPRKFMDNPTGCNDSNQCTADSCIESWTKEALNQGPLIVSVPWGSTANKDENGNVILDNDWQCSNEVMAWASCFAEDKCSPGECVVSGSGMPGDEYAVSCQALPDSSPQSQCPNLDANVCTTETCDINTGGCSSTNVTAAGVSCNDYNNCTTNDTCVPNTGECRGTPVSCTPANSCQQSSCGVDGGCVTTNFANGTPAGGPCTVMDEQGEPRPGKCGEGALVCMDGAPSAMCASLFSPSQEICDNNLDDDCDGQTDGQDEDCPQVLIFVTSGTFMGNLGGLAGADNICNTAASNASLPGTYTAWLSTNAINARDRVTQHAAPYLKTDGSTVVANSFADLTDGSILSPINLDEFGNPVAGTVTVWTHSNSAGNLKNAGQNACTTWTSSSPASEGAQTGEADETNALWTDSNFLGCDTARHLYCLKD